LNHKLKLKEHTDSMWNPRSGIIVRVLAYAPCLMFVARAEVEADASREFLDPPAQPSPGSAFNNTPAQVRAAAEDALQLLATVGHARVSAPEQMAEVLEKLRLESAAHLGRLDQEERTEMMAAMRGAGVALGDRNKLRLLTAEWQQNVATGLSAIGSQALRRVQQDGQEESRTNQQLKKQAEDHAGTAQPTGAQASGAISSDSAFCIR
jgi:hypothetical protein